MDSSMNSDEVASNRHNTLYEKKGLRSLSFPDSLDTSRDDVAIALYIPGLSAAVRYDRGVGYFTSGWLQHVGKGLSAFAGNGGQMRMITSPYLSAEDWGAVKQGHDARSDPSVLASLNQVLDDLERSAQRSPLTVLAWMVADNLLEIKIAVPTANLDGDFHPKLGVFEDASSDFVAFHGSQNETTGGFRNFETLHVHLGWTDDRDAAHATRIADTFNRLWDEHDPNVRCYRLPTAIRKRLARFADRTQRPYRRSSNLPTTTTYKWRHQDEACAAFLEHRAGVLAMATGTGKTRTALKIDAELRERDLTSSTIIAAYGTDLLDQWYTQLIDSDTVDLVYRAYGRHHEAQEFSLTKRAAALLINRRNLAELIPQLSAEKVGQTLLICDEVHGFGETGLVTSLNGKIRQFTYRLGLSATPTREYDQDGNDFIEREIGPVIYRFEIHEAIKRGILCELDYHPIEFQYSDDDRAAVQLAWARQAAREKNDEFDQTQLFMDLASVKKLSLEKIPLFEGYVRDYPNILQRCIIFVQQADYGALIQPLIMQQRVEFHTYYGDDQRENLKRFARGQLDCLIACKRISEGIDIQSVNNIVLFATARAPIETVQRVGRCLRTDEKNPHKRATVVDFIKVNDEGGMAADVPLTTDARRREWFEGLATVKTDEEIKEASP